MLLYKAADLGARLSVAFGSETGIPFSDVNLQTHNVHQPPWTQFSSLSEVSTLSLEFTYLERAAGESSPSIAPFACYIWALESRHWNVCAVILQVTQGRMEGLAPICVYTQYTHAAAQNIN